MILFCSTKPQEQYSFIIDKLHDMKSTLVFDNTQDFTELIDTLKNSTIYDTVIIDLVSYEQDYSVIEDLIKVLIMFSTSNVILLAFGHKSDEHIQRLSTKCSTIITAVSEDSILYELECHLNNKPINVNLSLHDTVTSTIPNAPMKQVRIGVYGICNRIGVTTFALQLSKYISSLSKSVLCAERNTSNHLFEVSKSVTCDIDEGNGIVKLDKHLHLQYYKELFDTDVLSGYSYIVYDLGAGGSCTIDEFLSCDIKVLICGSKSWELSSLSIILPQVYKDLNTHYVYNFTDTSDVSLCSGILKFMDYADTRTYFNGYSPTLLGNVSDDTRVVFDKVLGLVSVGNTHGVNASKKKGKRFFGLI